jgi:hypothetical protein
MRIPQSIRAWIRSERGADRLTTCRSVAFNPPLRTIMRSGMAYAAVEDGADWIKQLRSRAN